MSVPYLKTPNKPKKDDERERPRGREFQKLKSSVVAYALYDHGAEELDRTQTPMVKSCSMPGVTLAMNFSKLAMISELCSSMQRSLLTFRKTTRY